MWNFRSSSVYRFWFPAALGLVAVAAPAFSEQKECYPEAEALMADVTSSYDGRDLEALHYELLCKQKQRSSSSAEKLAIGILLEELPIQADGEGERKEMSVSEWCREKSGYEREFALRTMLKREAVRPTISMIGECLRMRAFDLAVQPRILGRGKVAVWTLTNRSGDDNPYLYEPRVTGNISCDVSGSTGTFDAEKRIPLPKNEAVTVTCTRETEQSGAMKEASVVLPSDFSSPITLFLPETEAFEISSKEARILEEQINSLSLSLVFFDEVRLANLREGKSKDSKTSQRVIADLCMLTELNHYGGATQQCSVKGNREEGWVLFNHARNMNVTCTMSCYNLIRTPTPTNP